MFSFFEEADFQGFYFMSQTRKNYVAVNADFFFKERRQRKTSTPRSHIDY